jgi:hypothetical protein
VFWVPALLSAWDFLCVDGFSARAGLHRTPRWFVPRRFSIGGSVADMEQEANGPHSWRQHPYE